MYKLLATTAIVMAVATPSFAWDNAKDIIGNLSTIYTSVDGVDEFNALQNGQLNTFITTVNKGVTHVTLTVNENKTITAGVNQGVTLQQIIDTSDDLINKVSFDLFNDNGVDAYDNAVDYGNIETQISNGTGSNGEETYVNDHGNGLVGARITTIVDTVNDINNLLTTDGVDGLSTEDANALTGAISNTNYTGVNLSGIDVAGFHSNIDGLNTAIETASNYVYDIDGNITDGTYFGNGPTTGLTNANIGNFKIDGFNSADGKVTDGNGTYASLVDWANGITE